MLFVSVARVIWECDPATEFTCRDNGQCIPIDSKCNSIPDCNDFSDEDPDECRAVISTGPPPCPEESFRCGSGVCIDSRYVCDNKNDCLDASDEQNCEDIGCRDDQFRCDDGTCIDGTLQCDGFADCEDYSDETSCQLIINGPPGDVNVGRRHLITCNATGGAGIPANIYWFLDPAQGGRRINITALFQAQDNPRASPFFIRELRRSTYFFTELYVMSVRPEDAGMYTCLVSDRLSSSYELKVAIEACGPGEFQCADSERCIDERRRCDGRPDCLDRSDEAGCQSCRPGSFRCGNGVCIDERRRCDRRADCSDRTDEEDCPEPCRADQFTCDNRRCVSQDQRCDRSVDCADGSDEAGCRKCCIRYRFYYVSYM
ncbi:hypothetical protein RRG08_059070 [Elysia crispata]|uniref:Ig-like domain-containing protein n=1 Tax=Elysia crispata TaxID=231223 RepID=A0AAE1B828_9GAST|nr:hypothetical protein RRG08_059070 [Elysia crispata]